jgi:hypothetical protein
MIAITVNTMISPRTQICDHVIMQLTKGKVLEKKAGCESPTIVGKLRRVLDAWLETMSTARTTQTKESFVLKQNVFGDAGSRGKIGGRRQRGLTRGGLIRLMPTSDGFQNWNFRPCSARRNATQFYK